MLYMVIECFKDGDAVSVYQRFQDQGRMLPTGLHYHSSWVEESFGRCFQLMECDDSSLLQEWISRWDDLVDFEVVPVRTSEEAVKVITPRLSHT